MIRWMGIRWSVHPLFVIIMLGSVMTGYFAELITLFILVLVHEFGHVFVARGFNWTVKEVKLLPFGGVVEVDEAGSLPAKEEALVAIAGPLQNVWMGMAAFAFGALGVWEPAWSEYIWKANLMLGLFNLLPIHPLDGGKLLQAGLSYIINYYTVLQWMARISLFFSLLMVLAAFLPLLLDRDGIQLNVMIVGLFLIYSNWMYKRHIPFLFYRFLMHRGHAKRSSQAVCQLASPILASESMSILSVAKLFYRERYHLIYMMDYRDQDMKALPEQRLVEDCLAGGNPSRAVSELFR